MASEPAMLSPLPRKPLAQPCGLLTSPAFCAASGHGVLDNMHEEATNELRTVMGFETPAKTLPNWAQALNAQCGSATSTTAAGSTSATSPLPPYSISLPSSPDRSSMPTSPLPPSDLDDAIEHLEHTQRPLCLPGAHDKSPWLQARKVFVGGVPQNIDQSTLYQMFSTVGKVKKAWLQLFRDERRPGRITTAKKHRGFGFVIFSDKCSVERLLGGDSSRHVILGDGVKLEVKLTVGKDNPSVDKQPEPCSPQALSVGLQHPSELPWVPQFPSAQTATPQCALDNGFAFPLHTLPSLAVACPPAFSFLSKVLLDGIESQMPLSALELEQVLLDAMPDRYED